MPNCDHPKVDCINPYELIRKYRCDDCREVMMCACDEEAGKHFLSHQIRRGKELETQYEVPVTMGFQKGICDHCRGLPLTPYPLAAIPGRTSKIRRYYWREIQFESFRRLGLWFEENNMKPRLPEGPRESEKFRKIEEQVLAEIKQKHAENPKYDMTEPSDSEILTQHRVEIVNLKATKLISKQKKITLLHKDKEYTVEEFVADVLNRQGYEVLKTESRPFHVLFGVFFYIPIQDPWDPFNRTASFGSRSRFDYGTGPSEIHTLLPEDFGTPGYFARKSDEIEEHLNLILEDEEELQWVFDYWLDGSAEFREYLWAHKPEDIEKARKLLTILGTETIKTVLRYMIKNYWGRYCGWPDLIAYNDNEYFFAEVKFSHDKLTGDQKNWVKGNSEEMFLPFKLIKVHKTNVQNAKS